MKTFKPSTLWPQYSMLRSTINIYEHIQINEYKTLAALLSSFSRGNQYKKAKVFTSEDKKVILVFGISGCCRKDEIYKVKPEDIKKQGELMQVKIPETKNKKTTVFYN